MSSSHHSAILLLGSNISPVENTRKALIELCCYGIIHRISRAWQSPPFCSPGPDFINLAIEFLTPLPLDEMKNNAIAAVETKLGRQRSSDKNAPRTIDVDIILFDDELLDQTIWVRPYAAVTIADLLPNLVDAAHKTTLAATASAFAGQHPLQERPDVFSDHDQ